MYGRINKLASHLIFLIFILSCSSLLGQDTLKQSKGTLVDVYIAYGSFAQPWNSTRASEFVALTSGSQLMQGSIMNEPVKLYYGPSAPEYLFRHGSKGRVPFYLQAGFTIKLTDNEEKDFDGPWLKLGLNHFGDCEILAGDAYLASELQFQAPYKVGMYNVQRDSVHIQTLSYSFVSNSTAAEATFLYKVNEKGIFSLFGGAGVWLGARYGGEAKVTSWEYTQVTDSLIYSNSFKGPYSSGFTAVKKTEKFKVGPGVALGVFLDMGVDLKLGAHYPFFRNLHLYGEIKPMFRSDLVSRVGFDNKIYYLTDLGLRYAF
jgi:hypothetical protein